VKQLLSRLKPYLRWAILGGTLFFLVATLKKHWQEVGAIRLTTQGWGYLAIALLVTLLAHLWSGWVWGWILQLFNQSVSGGWSLRVYLKTNLAKYLPGNVWHFYGRVMAAKSIGIPLGAATLSVVLEPLLMAAAALMVTLVGNQLDNWAMKVVSLVVVLMGVHPRVLNPIIHKLSRAKQKGNDTAEIDAVQLNRYPIVPLLGELGFVGLRGAGFLLAMLAVTTFDWQQIPLLIGAFSFSWLLGLVVPGAPGGVGVFEVTAIALLDNHFATALILSVVALYRLISVLAETIGAGLVWLYERGVGESER
jgi:glycosyltransferase 2 family protein